MFPPALEKQRRQLYEKTVKGMSGRLRAVTEPGEMIAALGWGMKELDHALAETPARVRTTIACRSGCDFCCSVPVDVQAHEVFFAAEYIQVNFSPTDLAGVIDHTAIHRARVAQVSAGGRERLRQPCVLLQAGRCSIYAGRPEACRSHHTSDASVCAAHSKNPDTNLEKTYIPVLRARMFAVMLGMDAAIEEAGFDDRSYDFGSALHEALTNSLCRVLWMRKKPAFPDSCLADQGESDEA